MFDNILEEVKKKEIKTIELTINSNNYIAKHMIEEKENLRVSCDEDKLKYAVKV